MGDGVELSDGLQLILVEPSLRQDAIGFLANSPISAVNHAFNERAVWRRHAQQVAQRIIRLPPLVLATRSIAGENTAVSLLGSPLRPVSSNAGCAGAGRIWVRLSAPAAGGGKETVVPNC